MIAPDPLSLVAAAPSLESAPIQPHPDAARIDREVAGPHQPMPNAQRVDNPISEDRTNLAVEAARQAGGMLDVDDWTTPSPERVATLLRNEPDQMRIDRWAYEAMTVGADAQAKGTGGGIHEHYKPGLRLYRDWRKSRGEEPFQYLQDSRSRAEQRAAREKVPFFRKLFTTPETMAEAFPPEERASFEERFSGSSDASAEKQRTAGILLVSEMMKRDETEVAEYWNNYRDRYGRDVLKMSGAIDDNTFYQAAGASFTKEEKEDELARQVAQQAQRAAIQGRPLSHAVEQGKALTGAEEWKRFEPGVRAGYASILSQFSDSEIKAGRSLFEAVADMEGKPADQVAKGDGEKAAWVLGLEAYGNAPQGSRDRILSLIGLQADAEGEDVPDYFKRIGLALSSGSDLLTTGVGTLGARSRVAEYERMAENQTDPKLKAELQAGLVFAKGQAALAIDLDTAGVKVRRYIDQKREGFWDTAGDWSVMAAESVPMMAGAALPFGAGLPVVAAAYGERNLSTLRRESPNADPATLAATAYTSGALEAGIDRLQVFTLGARLPKLNSKLMTYGKPGAVLAAGARTMVVTGAETIQEVAQDLTLPVVQQFASVLAKDMPGPNWDKVLGDEAEALGDIAGVSLIFGIIGGTGSTIMDYAQAPKIAEALRDREGLAIAGHSAETIEEVATLADKNPAAAAEALKAAMISTPKEERQANAQAARERLEGKTKTFRPTEGKVTSYGYADDTTPDSNSSAGVGAWVSDDEQERIRAGEDTENRLRPGDIAVSRDVERQFRADGLEPGDTVSIRLDDGTEHSGRWMDRTPEEYEGTPLTGRFDLYSPDGVNPLDGRQVVGWASETTEGTTAAQAALPTMEKQQDGKVVVSFPDAPAILADSPEFALEAVREWDQQQEVDTTRAVREYIDYLTDYHASNPEAVFTGKQTGKSPTLETWAAGSKDRLTQANARVDILMKQAGTAMGIDRPLLSEVPILGTNRNVRAGAVTRMVAEIHNGGNPLTVVEEAAEGVAKWLLADSKVSESKMLGWLRDTEKSTNTKFLSDDIANMTPEARLQELSEGFSYVARNNAVGRIQESALPSGVKAFFRAFKETIAQVLRMAADFARLRSEGKVNAEFAYWLDVAAGIDPDFQMENLTRQMESEMLAEAMDGFTEVSDALKGRMPHPDTLEDQGDPLAGEVRRLYEGILENPESGASKAARTRKANEWFLPKGETANLDEVRRLVNELGFDFATPAEMIDAADLSINSGRKIYGTTDTGTDEGMTTFSIGQPVAQDAYFIAAVESGDMETAGKLVEAAALAAGYKEKVYHGTTAAESFDVFTPTTGEGAWYGTGIYVSRSRTAAEHYAKGGRVIEGFARMENTRAASSRDDMGAEEARGFTEKLKAEGYDSIEVTGRDESANEIVLFSPSQIKSAEPVTRDSAGNVVPLSQRFNPARQSMTFSIALRTDPLLEAIQKQIKSPEKKAQTWRKAVKLTSAVRRRFEDRRLSGEFDSETGDIDKARFEQIRDVATLEAIAKAMPPDIRGKLVGNFRKVADLKTTKGRTKYMTELLPKIEQALESSLKKEYRAAIRKQMKQGALKLSEAKTRGGKIGALGHAVFEEAKAAMKLTDDPSTQPDGKSAAEKADEAASALRETLESSPRLTDDQIAELDGRIRAIELFGAYGDADSRRLAEALGFLQGTYAEGREEWLHTLTARRDWRANQVTIVEQAMGREGPVTDAERVAAKRRSESMLKKFSEGVMQMGLSGSQKIRRLAELTRSPGIMALTEEMEMAFMDAEAQEADANEADNEALAKAMRKFFGVTTEYGVSKKLRDLTTANAAAPVEKIEGQKTETVKVPVRFVEAILAGEFDMLEAGGEKFAREVKEFGDHDLANLELAWEQFSDLPEADQSRRRVISFERILADGERTTIGRVTQLEGLQLWLTMRQPDQQKKLERMGYDAQTLAQLEAWLKPDVKQLGIWMVDRIGAGAFTLDSIHRAEKGVGLKLVENYFPVRNDVAGTDNSGLSLDGARIKHTGRSVTFIKERVANDAPPAYTNALAVFLANRAQMNFWTSHVAPLREWGGLVRDERFATAVKVRMGETYYRSLDTLMKRIEGGGSANAAQLMDYEKILKRMTSSFAVGTLGLRVSTLAVNMGAALNAGLEIPAAELAQGFADIIARPEAFKDAFNSPAIQRRLAQGSSFEAQLAKSSGPSRRPIIAQLTSWAEKGVMPINWVDTGSNVLGAAIVWEHTRKASLRAGLDESAARVEADRKVARLLLRAAQPTSRLAKSELEMKALDNPLAALFTLFTSEPRKVLSIVYLAAREVTTGKGTRGTPMALQQLFVALVMVQTADFMIRAAYSAAAKAEDDEPEDFVSRLKKRIFDGKAWGHAIATTHLRSVPIAGELWNQGSAALFDQKVFQSSPNPFNRAAREVITFEKPETTGEALEGGIDILQSVGPMLPGGAFFAQGGNVVEFVTGVATSNGVDFSNADRAERLKARFNTLRKELETTHGPTMRPTRKEKDGKPIEKADKKVQALKWAAQADRLRSDLAGASAEVRRLVLDSVNAPQAVKERVEKELKHIPAPFGPPEK